MADDSDRRPSPEFELDLAGIGMSVIDTLQVVEELPSAEGVTEVLEHKTQGGGPVPTAIVTAARLGARTAIIDRIGSDWRGELAAREYREAGVGTADLMLEPGKTTTFGTVLVRRRDGARHIVFSPGDFTPIRTDELPLATIRSAKILHLNGRHWPACIAAAWVARENGGEVSFDGGANRFRESIRELLIHVDIHIAAREFAGRLAGSDDTGDQLAAMIGLGARIAGITDGVRGSWFATAEGEVFHQPAFEISPVMDTTGCGDVFHGAFLFAHSRGWTARESATFASAAAAINATALGGRGCLPALEQIRELIADGSLARTAPDL